MVTAKPALVHKVLVVHTAFLGDLVLSTSFLANLRALLPNAEIRFLTTPVGAGLLSPNAFGIVPIFYDKRGKDRGFGGFVRMAREIRTYSPDLVFCLHRSLRSVLLARLAGGVAWGFHSAAGSVLFKHRVRRLPKIFEAEKNHQLLEAWAKEQLQNFPLFPRLSASPQDEAEAENLLAGIGKFVAIAPGSVWATKRWPADRFSQVAAMLWEKHQLRTVVVGGNDAADLEASRILLASYPGTGEKSIPLDLVGKTSLGSLKSVLSRASLVVANDSAPLHVAIAMGAPVLGVFGPTTKDLGFFPLAPEGKSGVVENVGLDCRPCGMHGHHTCPRTHFRCMLGIEPETVFQEAEKLLCL